MGCCCCLEEERFGFDSSFVVWLQSWADVIQFDLSEMFDRVCEGSEVDCLSGMNSSRTGFSPFC